MVLSGKRHKQKMQAVSEVKRQGYQPQPLRRIYIPKKDGRSKRPLSIPTMIDEATSPALMALEPLVETIADKTPMGLGRIGVVRMRSTVL